MKACEAQRAIKNYFKDTPDGEDPVAYFINYFYHEKGLSLTDIAKYVIGNKCHSTILKIAKKLGIERDKPGGMVSKYRKVIRCECGNEQELLLLTRNVNKHKTLELKCKKCGGILK